MKLYFNPQSRAVTAQWMLDECGAQYDIVPIDLRKREHKTPAFLAINPAGKLPALVDGRARIFETAAICLYLAEKFPLKRLAPAAHASARGRYLSLMVYSTAQLEPAMGDALLGVRSSPASRGWTTFEQAKDVVERELGYGPYLFGAQFTAADIMIGSLFIWLRMWGRRSGREKIDHYVDRLLARPHAIKLPGHS
ncbi:MAG: glutathione S-transferase family protein [Burkholderiaceae bacterium]|jgi:glutathione S-transferase|nr:glutathione S-transferase family protein [Burkholderiaceae bacterium]